MRNHAARERDMLLRQLPLIPVAPRLRLHVDAAPNYDQQCISIVDVYRRHCRRNGLDELDPLVQGRLALEKEVLELEAKKELGPQGDPSLLLPSGIDE